MKLNKEQKEKYYNMPAFGYFTYTGCIEFYVLDVIYDIDDYLIIQEEITKKLHCLKLHYETIIPYINYYGNRVSVDQIYRY